METVKPNLKPVMSKHLKELIADMEMYRWALIRAYYQVWLQHIENGQAKWIEAKAKLEFHRVLVWHSTPSTTKNKHAHATLPPKKAESLRSNTMIMAKLGTIACTTFIKTGCKALVVSHNKEDSDSPALICFTHRHEVSTMTEGLYSILSAAGSWPQSNNIDRRLMQTLIF